MQGFVQKTVIILIVDISCVPLASRRCDVFAKLV